MANHYITIGEEKFIEKGEYVINEICKKFDDPTTKIMFSEAAEAFLDEFNAYLFKERKVKN